MIKTDFKILIALFGQPVPRRPPSPQLPHLPSSIDSGIPRSLQTHN